MLSSRWNITKKSHAYLLWKKINNAKTRKAIEIGIFALERTNTLVLQSRILAFYHYWFSRGETAKLKNDKKMSFFAENQESNFHLKVAETP